MKKILILLAAITFACSDSEFEADAYGNFEAVEITVSSQNTGIILNLGINEGDRVNAGDTLGLTDTVNLHLKKEQLLAQIELAKTKTPNLYSEIDVLIEQKKNLEKELKRFIPLADKGAAPQKQVDDIEDQIEVIDKKIDAVKTQNTPVLKEIKLIESQIKQIDKQINDAFITAPVSGTILVKTAEEGEFAVTGKPLFRMAELETMTFKAFFGATQLSDIQLGQKVIVRTDKNKDNYREHDGTISKIASEAEFTPKIIQTKEERTDLVYAVEIIVPNKGDLKIGMPGEVIIIKNKAKNDDKSR